MEFTIVKKPIRLQLHKAYLRTIAEILLKLKDDEAICIEKSQVKKEQLFRTEVAQTAMKLDIKASVNIVNGAYYITKKGV